MWSLPPWIYNFRFPAQFSLIYFATLLPFLFAYFSQEKKMPDLGNLSLSESLTLTRCPNFKPVLDPTDITSSFVCEKSVKSLPSDCISSQGFQCPLPIGDEVGGGCGIRVSTQSGDVLDRSKRNYGGKNLEDHVKSWVRRKQESGVPESRSSFPFLQGARKMVISLTDFFLRFTYYNIRASRLSKWRTWFSV